jgi:hypothetical protein
MPIDVPTARPTTIHEHAVWRDGSEALRAAVLELVRVDQVRNQAAYATAKRHRDTEGAYFAEVAVERDANLIARIGALVVDPPEVAS